MANTLQAQDTNEPFSDTDYELLGNPTYRVVSGCAVTYDAANLTVDVAAGVIKHNGSFVTVSEQLNVVTIAVDGSNPRWSYLTINGSGTVILTSGTAASTPVKPEAPEGVFLAMLLVVNGDTTANGITVKLDKRILSDVTGVSPQATAIGDAQALGTGDQAAREDHVHASASPSAPTTLAVGTTAAAGSSANSARQDHAHGETSPGAPDALAIPQTGATGSATTTARADHVHGIGTPAAPTTHSIPTTAAAGSSGDFARRDHAHGQTAPATPNVIQIGDSAAVGTGTDAAREDHEHGLVAPATPTTQAFGDSAATGSGTDPAREDHTHGMPAAPSGGAWTRVGGSTSEATTSSTSAVSLVTVGSLNIPAATPIFITFNYRKSAGAGLRSAAGLQLNSTVVHEANASDENYHSDTNRAEDGFCWMYLPPTVTNYTSGYGFGTMTRITSSGVYAGGKGFPSGSYDGTTNSRPTAAITSVVIRGEAGHALLTFGVDEVHVYTWGVS
jgi:hypothetical protein